MRKQNRIKVILSLVSLVCFILFAIKTCNKNPNINKLKTKNEMKSIDTNIQNSRSNVEHAKKKAEGFDKKTALSYNEYRNHVNRKDTVKAILSADTLIKLQMNQISVMDNVVQAQDTLIHLLTDQNDVLKSELNILKSEKRMKSWKTIGISVASTLAAIGIIEFVTK